ncbi:MAG TPA: tRNA (adenosine(37)-N6)-threonylcarbamoyltransferase complex ATPase subunit type 1 TsaE [Burkholderiaceae bacterium]|nr:tRNA (adenosine(37)-N6)-threonylcarbamoyltransferase complex ATPase subunit type 1 TsaE [Burkholderiaceae bacterium]
MLTSLNLQDAEATAALGRSMASAVKRHVDAIRAAGLHINLSGELGAGKTALVRAMLHALGVEGSVKSPTYAVLEPYVVSRLDFYHFDFFRLTEREFDGSGFRELFGPGRICAVEWPERAGPRLPTADISIALAVDGYGRSAAISTASELGATCLSEAMTQLEAGGGDSSTPAPARLSSP